MRSKINSFIYMERKLMKRKSNIFVYILCKENVEDKLIYIFNYIRQFIEIIFEGQKSS